MAYVFSMKEMAGMPFPIPSEAKICPCGCGLPLEEGDTEMALVGDTPQKIRADCYFKGIGDLIDQRPVGTPGFNR